MELSISAVGIRVNDSLSSNIFEMSGYFIAKGDLQ